VVPLAASHQGNALSLITGADLGIRDNDPTRVFTPSIVDLLEARNVSWKVYAEEYPGSCNLNAGMGNYRRYRVPFLNLEAVQSDRFLCSKVATYRAWDSDVDQGLLPRLSIVIPGLQHSGALGSASMADTHLSRLMDPILTSPAQYADTTIIVTTVSGEGPGFHFVVGNRVNTSGTTVTREYSLYSVLRTIQLALDLGHLNQQDALALPMTDGWR
jgi:phospholipase C